MTGARRADRSGRGPRLFAPGAATSSASRRGLPALAPRIVLADLPTPVTPLPDLARELGLAELLVKRDDATSPLYGGTKVRGLEFFFGRALALGRSWRGHARLGRQQPRGRDRDLRPRDRNDGPRVLFPHPDPEQARANVDRLARARRGRPRTGWLGLVPALVRGRLDRAGTGRGRSGSRRAGAPALGVLGAAEGALEVVEDGARGHGSGCPRSSSSPPGRAAPRPGSLLGFALARAPVRVVAVRVVPRLVASRRRILRLARGGLAILRSGRRPRGDRSPSAPWRSSRPRRGRATPARRRPASRRR